MSTDKLHTYTHTGIRSERPSRMHVESMTSVWKSLGRLPDTLYVAEQITGIKCFNRWGKISEKWEMIASVHHTQGETHIALVTFLCKKNTNTGTTASLSGVVVCVHAFYLDSGYLVNVARLLVYMWPPTSICTGALAFVSCAGVGMPAVHIGEAGECANRGRVDMPTLLLRFSWGRRNITVVEISQSQDSCSWRKVKTVNIKWFKSLWISEKNKKWSRLYMLYTATTHRYK